MRLPCEAIGDLVLYREVTSSVSLRRETLKTILLYTPCALAPVFHWSGFVPAIIDYI